MKIPGTGTTALLELKMMVEDRLLPSPKRREEGTPDFEPDRKPAD